MGSACIRLQREERDRDHEAHGGHHRPGHHVRVEQPAHVELSSGSYSVTHSHDLQASVPTQAGQAA